MSRQSIVQIPEFHPKQAVFYDSKATKILLAGDTRGGKTSGVKLSLIRWCALIPGLQCDIFRLHEDDVIGSYMEGDFSFPVLLNQWVKDGLVRINKTEVRFVFNGSLITLEHCSTDTAMSKHQGIPKHVRIFDEAGQIPERRMKWLEGWMVLNEDMKQRLPPEWRDQFPKIIYLSNPLGPSKAYLRKTFVKARPKFEIEAKGAWKTQYIPFIVEDNPSEDAATTRARVAEIADESTATALLDESKAWDVQTGNYFSTWDSDLHVIKDFVIPDFWLRFRTFDYGSYEPWACLWVAVSPGVTIHQGTAHERYLPRKSLIVYREWYGCRAEHPKTKACENITNLAPEGWSNEDMAKGIIERTEERFDTQPTFTDGFPFNNLGGRTIAKEFKDIGVTLTKGDTDRKNRGAQTLSKLNGVKLIAGSEQRFPMLYFFESCKYCQDYMPMIERHPSEGRAWDYQEDGEATHICFAGDTLVQTKQGLNRIDQLKAGDIVLAGDGYYRPISAAGLTRKNTQVIKLIFDNGSEVVCTPDHRFLTTHGWIRACDCVTLNVVIGECESSLYQKQFKSLTDVNIEFTGRKLITPVVKIGFIGLCGNTITGKLGKGCIFITSMATRQITKLKILKFSLPRLISESMTRLGGGTNIEKTWNKLGHWLRLGIARLKELLGTRNIILETQPPKCTSFETINVYAAKKNFNPLKLELNIALKNVGNGTVKTLRCISLESKGVADVYCLTEPVSHSFQLASGLVVKNCDCVTLASMVNDTVLDAPLDTKAATQQAIRDRRNKNPTMKELAPEIVFT